MGIRSSRCPDSGHQKQMSGDRGYRRLEQDDMLKYVPFGSGILRLIAYLVLPHFNP